MKVLFILLAPILLTGCDSLARALRPVQEFYSDLTKSNPVKTDVVAKADTSGKKAAEPVATLPPPATKGLAAKPGTPSATLTPAPPVSHAPGPFTPSNVLRIGSQGAEVLALQKRLAELGYEVGAADGFYGQQTWQGVVAFQKYANLRRTGTYTLETQKALHTAKLPEGLYPGLGMPRIEIDLRRQLLLFIDEQGLGRVISVSTGSNRKYCEISKKSGKQVCGTARTPRGKFRIQRKIPGWRESDLGKLFNPLYFNGGYAIHGSPLVPAYNVSHGCVRLSIPTSLWFYDTVKNGTPVIVFD